MRRSGLAIALCGTLFLGGCAAMDGENKYAIRGAAAGAASGAMFGLAFGDPLVSGLIGGLVGGVGGLIYDEHRED